MGSPLPQIRQDDAHVDHFKGVMPLQMITCMETMSQYFEMLKELRGSRQES